MRLLYFYCDLERCKRGTIEGLLEIVRSSAPMTVVLLRHGSIWLITYRVLPMFLLLRRPSERNHCVES